ncbi:hypothetical protein [Kitasatospora sp. NPDC059571]
MHGGRRDFAQPRSMQPSRYKAVVDATVDDGAVGLSGAPQTTGTGPTRT